MIDSSIPAASSSSSSSSSPTPSSTQEMFRVIRANFIENQVKELNKKPTFDEKVGYLNLKKIIDETKQARDVAIGSIIQRQQAFYSFANAWDVLQDKRHEQVIVIKPWENAVDKAQENLRALPRELVIKNVQRYCDCLVNVANTYAIAEAGIYEIDKLNDMLNFF
jgi:hypothetical protein